MSDYCKECTYCGRLDNRITRNEKEIEDMDKRLDNDSWWARVLAFVGVIFTGFMGMIGAILGFYGKAQGWW